MANNKFWVIEIPDGDGYYWGFWVHSVYASKEEALPVFDSVIRECELKGIGTPTLKEYFSKPVPPKQKQFMEVRFRTNLQAKVAKYSGATPVEERKEGIEVKDIDPCFKSRIFYKEGGMNKEAILDKVIIVYIPIENETRKELIEKAMKVMEKEGYKL